MGRHRLGHESHMLLLGQKLKAKDADTWPGHTKVSSRRGAGSSAGLSSVLYLFCFFILT